MSAETKFRTMPTIYLCGPISGRSVEEMSAWRRHSRAVLRTFASVWDPTEFTVDSNHPATPRPDDPAHQVSRIAHGRAVIERDLQAVRAADLLLANLVGASDPSIGSIGEMFWAYAFNVPIILVRDAQTIYSHSMLEAMAAIVCEDIDTALAEALAWLERR